MNPRALSIIANVALTVLVLQANVLAQENRVSDNVGGVKHFLGILVRALRKSAPFRSR